MFTICKFSNHFRVSSFVGLVHGPGFVSIPDFVISIKLAKRGQLNSSQNRDSDNEPGTAHLPMVNFVIFCFKFPCPQHNCLDFDCLQIPAMNQLHPPMGHDYHIAWLPVVCSAFLYLACLGIETSNSWRCCSSEFPILT